MRRIHAIVVLAVLLTFGLSFAIPADNLPETSYDESEPAPYETTPHISTLMLTESARFASDVGRRILPIRLSANVPNRTSSIGGPTEPGGASLSSSLLASPLQVLR